MYDGDPNEMVSEIRHSRSAEAKEKLKELYHLAFISGHHKKTE